MSRHRSARLALALAIAVLLPAVLSACPLCKDAVSDGDYPGGGASLGLGFYYSILLMVSAPFAIVGLLFYRITRARRRNRPVSAAAGGVSLAPETTGARS